MTFLFESDQLLFIGGGVFLFALLLLLIGMRGRRVSDHIYCRHCNFDLFGSFDHARGRSEWHCPECGRNLADNGVLKIGQRRRAPLLIATGFFLIVIPSAGGALALWGEMTGFDWNSVKPLWLLRHESGLPGQQGSEAWEEMARRFERGDLQPDDLVELLQISLQRQADPIALWRDQYGRIIETARRRGEVNDAQWEQYLNKAFEFKAGFVGVSEGDQDNTFFDGIAWRAANPKNNAFLEIDMSTISRVSESLLQNALVTFDQVRVQSLGESPVDVVESDSVPLPAISPMFKSVRLFQKGRYQVDAKIIVSVDDPIEKGARTDSKPIILSFIHEPVISSSAPD